MFQRCVVYVCVRVLTVSRMGDQHSCRTVIYHTFCPKTISWTFCQDVPKWIYFPDQRSCAWLSWVASYWTVAAVSLYSHNTILSSCGRAIRTRTYYTICFDIGWNLRESYLNFANFHSLMPRAHSTRCSYDRLSVQPMYKFYEKGMINFSKWFIHTYISIPRTFWAGTTFNMLFAKYVPMSQYVNWYWTSMVFPVVLALSYGYYFSRDERSWRKGTGTGRGC